MKDDRETRIRKEELRRNILAERTQAFSRDNEGKAAERLRRTPFYRKAQTILVSLHGSLYQARLNVLADRKRLILPTPKLQRGWMLLDSTKLPLRRLKAALQAWSNPREVPKIPYGKPLHPPIDLIITDALAVGQDGSLLGEGSGYLDIQCALLHTLGWMSPDVQVVAVVEEHQIVESVPMEKTDVGAHWIVTARDVFETPCTGVPQEGVRWENLTMKQIRQNDGLFFFYRQLQPHAMQGDLGNSSGKKELDL